jgi:hypothetical protein
LKQFSDNLKSTYTQVSILVVFRISVKTLLSMLFFKNAKHRRWSKFNLDMFLNEAWSEVKYGKYHITMYVKVTLIMLAQKIMVTMNRAHTCTNSLKLFPSMTQLLLEFCIWPLAPMSWMLHDKILFIYLLDNWWD